MRVVGLGDGPGGPDPGSEAFVGTPAQWALPFTRTASYPSLGADVRFDGAAPGATFRCTITVDGRVVVRERDRQDHCTYSEDPEWLPLLWRTGGGELQ